jgi:translocation protein SEC63
MHKNVIALDAPLNSHQQPKDDSHGSDDDDENPVIEQTIAKKKSTRNDENEDDTFLEKFQQQQRKREKLETKEKISQRVFCPFYPEVTKYNFHLFFLIFSLFKIKQECWWLYVADKKTNSLISVPVYLCTLKDDEEVDRKKYLIIDESVFSIG